MMEEMKHIRNISQKISKC